MNNIESELSLTILIMFMAYKKDFDDDIFRIFLHLKKISQTNTFAFY